MNNSLRTLKNILQSQKTAIENKGGTVVVNNLNVSPSEITDGINSIPTTDFTLATATSSDVVEGKTFYAQDRTLKTGEFKKTDFTLATATENDVIQGKTFYSQDNNLKTGTFSNYTDFSVVTATQDDVLSGKTFYAVDGSLQTGNYEPVVGEDIFFNLYIKPKNEVAESSYVYTYPERYSTVRNHLFHSCSTTCDMYFPDNITTVDSYAFYDCCNFSFPNFTNSNINKVNDYAFWNSRVNLENLPRSLRETSIYCFGNCAKYNIGIKLLNTITTYGSGIFHCTSPFPTLDYFDASEYTAKEFCVYMVQGIHFNCHFVVPDSIEVVSNYFNNGGSFAHITINSNVRMLGNYCFGAGTSVDPSSNLLQTVTINRQTPPDARTNVFPVNKSNYTIYVPDESVDAYKTKSGYTQFANLIKPISEKE